LEAGLAAAIAEEIVTHSPEETTEFGRRLAKQVKPPCWVLLEGELGSGKTTLAKGIVAGLGAAREDEVTSPSFTLVHEHGATPKAYHVDLYRIETPAELASLGLEELLAEEAIVIVEWGEKLAGSLPFRLLRVRLEHVENDQRRITVEPVVSYVP